MHVLHNNKLGYLVMSELNTFLIIVDYNARNLFRVHFSLVLNV